jgi:hypothetical protein
VHEDMAWSYPFPMPECTKIAQLMAFYNEKLDVYRRRSASAKTEAELNLRVHAERCVGRAGAADQLRSRRGSGFERGPNKTIGGSDPCRGEPCSGYV